MGLWQTGWGRCLGGILGILTACPRWLSHINAREMVIWGFSLLQLPAAMGNTPGVPEGAEDDNTCTVKSYQVSSPTPLAAASAIPTLPMSQKLRSLLFQPLSEPPEGIKNGSVMFAQNPPPAVNGEGTDWEGEEVGRIYCSESIVHNKY